jgi:hypothetical protein
MIERILLNASFCELEKTNAMSEAIDAVCEELGLDAHNSLSREIVAHEVIECARLERDPERIYEMVVRELSGPSAAA